MAEPSSRSEVPSSIATLLMELEERSRARPDRVLRLRGCLPAEGGEEPFELLIFRGFSSLTTHPTAFDPDRPALPEGSRIDSAELLEAPLTPEQAIVLSTTTAVVTLLELTPWP